jgi:hypothetical protein
MQKASASIVVSRKTQSGPNYFEKEPSGVGVSCRDLQEKAEQQVFDSYLLGSGIWLLMFSVDRAGFRHTKGGVRLHFFIKARLRVVPDQAS